jgi:hypothetical protein
MHGYGYDFQPRSSTPEATMISVTTFPRIIPLAFAMTFASSAPSQRVKPLPSPIGIHPSTSRQASAVPAAAVPGTWTPLVNQPTFILYGASDPMLLTDGTVLVQDQGSSDWWKLTPDANGSYINGTWSQVASMPNNYAPLYHSSAVLPDGRLIIEGGEYLDFVPTWTNLGAIYDPIADSWTPVAPPDGWTSIGDAQGVVLADGTYMQANCCTTQAALLDAKTLTWRPTGSNKFDVNDEEGWTLLPNSEVLTVDAYVPIGLPYIPDGTNSELYSPRRGSWHSAGSTIVQLWDSASTCGGDPVASFEVGPGVLRPDGTVFYTGSNSCGPANTAIYNWHKRTWTPGPTFPGDFGVSDGPAALEPNGKVILMASPYIFQYPSQFFEWDGSVLNPIDGPPNASYDTSYYGNMLVLPTGQILLTDFSDDIEIYTPEALSRRPEWAPRIHHAPPTVQRGSSYEIRGRYFNGMSQGSAYGDDVQAATNYPIVRMTNVATGHVFYSRTHDHSSMAVASDDPVSTQFDVPAAQETGLSRLEVVANGVASRPVLVNVY